jgi:small subunit ribosomal protein S16
MPVKMRLQRKGRRKAPFYHIVIADSRAPRDGKYIENIGSYNPMTVPATIELDREKAFDWLQKGAQPTETMRAILRFKGVLHRKHLMQGVKKGAMTVEDAETKYAQFVEEKEGKIEARRQKALAEKRAKWAAINGTKPAKVVATTTEVEVADDSEAGE